MIARAVCLRRGEDGIEVLLVRTSSGKRWVFPGGHGNDGEEERMAVSRELQEEAGYYGELDFAPYAISAILGKDESFFIARGAQPIGTPEPGRAPTWYGIEAAELALAQGRDSMTAYGLQCLLKSAVREYLQEHHS